MKFRTKIICNECDTEFDQLPENEVCPVCVESKELCGLIDQLSESSVDKDIYDIRSRVAKFDDGIPKFDLYNKLNKKLKLISLM